MSLNSVCTMNDNSRKPPPDSPNVAQTPVFDVRELFAGGREAILIHAGERYRLRITANDKLILTK
jgi:hemin uptake protein HemP